MILDLLALSSMPPEGFFADLLAGFRRQTYDRAMAVDGGLQGHALIDREYATVNLALHAQIDRALTLSDYRR